MTIARWRCNSSASRRTRSSIGIAQVGALRPAPAPRGTTQSRCSPIAWSTRTPPAWRKAARSQFEEGGEAAGPHLAAGRRRSAPNPGRAARRHRAARRPRRPAGSRAGATRHGCRRHRCRRRGRRSARSASRRPAPPAAPRRARHRPAIGRRRGRRPRRGCRGRSAGTPGLSGVWYSAGQSRQSSGRGRAPADARAAPRTARAFQRGAGLAAVVDEAGVVGGGRSNSARSRASLRARRRASRSAPSGRAGISARRRGRAPAAGSACRTLRKMRLEGA